MNRTLTVLVCIMVAGVVVGASLPIFDSLTASSESVHNDGAGWVRFALDRNAGTTYTLSYTSDDDGFYIDNGTDRQTYDDSSTSDFETILYADSNLSVWCDGDIHILGTIEGHPVYLEGNGAFTIVRDAEGVTISSEGTDLASFGVPTWAYIPVSTGSYGFFNAADFDSELGNGVKNYPSDMPLAVVSSGFAGVYAYNDIYRYNGLEMNMHPVYDDDGLFYGAYWDATAPVEIESDDLNVIDPFNPDDVVFDPIDIQPIDIDPLDPGMQIMSVPTPTYTDGDWGYDLTTYNSQTVAQIVSYSGTGGDVVVPATVGGYNVIYFGKGTDGETVFNNSVNVTSLTLPEGLIEVKLSACKVLSNLTGTLTLPSTLTKINNYAFYGCKFTGELVIPGSVTLIGQGAFESNDFTSIVINSGIHQLTGPTAFARCTQLTSISVPNSVTKISGSGIFTGCTSLTEVEIPDSVTTFTAPSLFKDCTSLTKVKLPSGITTIPQQLFSGCTSLKEYTIPSSVATIDLLTFTGTGLITIVIPSTVTTINREVFKNCTDAVGLVVYGDPTYGTDVFTGTTNLKQILNLGSEDITLTTSGLNADEIRTDLPCFGFISVVDVAGGGSGTVGTLIAILPLVMVVGLVLVAIGMVVWNRMM